MAAAQNALEGEPTGFKTNPTSNHQEGKEAHVTRPTRVPVSEHAQMEFMERLRAKETQIEDLNKTFLEEYEKTKPTEREYLATEINKLTFTLFYEVKAFRSEFSEENKLEMEGILKVLNKNVQNTGKQLNFEVVMIKLPPVDKKHVETLLMEDEASLYNIAINQMHEDLKRFAQEELKVSPEKFLLSFEEFQKRIQENRRILRAMVRDISNSGESKEDIATISAPQLVIPHENSV